MAINENNIEEEKRDDVARNKDYAIEVRKITKSYGEKKVVKNVSFAVEKGTIHALIGPNGAGKTTILFSTVNLNKTDSGDVFINGKSIYKNPYFNKDIAFVPSEDNVNFDVEVEDYVISYNTLRGMKKEDIKKELNNSALGKFRYHKLKSLSTGWRRITSLFTKSLSKPSIYILDEPSNGLDPTMKYTLFERLKELRDQGASVLLSSHTLPDLQKLASAVTMIKNGEVVYNGPMTKDIEDTYNHYFIIARKDKEIKEKRGIF